MQYQKLGSSGLYIPSLGEDKISRIQGVVGLTVEKLKKNDTPERRNSWHEDKGGGVNFIESPINPDSSGDIVNDLGFDQRILGPFETGTIFSAMILGSIREHNDARSLGLETLRTLFIPLSLPEGSAEFGTGIFSSRESVIQIAIGSAVCFNQQVQHHLIFNAQERLGTGIAIFVTRESFERVWSRN